MRTPGEIEAAISEAIGRYGISQDKTDGPGPLTGGPGPLDLGSRFDSIHTNATLSGKCPSAIIMNRAYTISTSIGNTSYSRRPTYYDKDRENEQFVGRGRGLADELYSRLGIERIVCVKLDREGGWPIV
jgi:hypothetical protein